MELQIKPYHKNSFPLQGFLIQNPSVAGWVLEIQRLQLKWQELMVYPIPGTVANSVWGCFVLLPAQLQLTSIGKNEWCQKVSDNLYIPERTIVIPALLTNELETLLPLHQHVYHPDFGLVELTDVVSLRSQLVLPLMKDCHTVKPKAPLFIPEQIKSFQVKQISPEEVIRHMEENVFPKKDKMKTDPLNQAEKAKLSFYKLLFERKNNKSTEKTKLMSRTQSFFKSLFSKAGVEEWSKRMQEDFEALEKRNQSNLDKLLDMLKNNPDEALKYAIPLDERGTTRGGETTRFDLTKRWFDFSLFGNLGNSAVSRSSGSINIGNHYGSLQDQYKATAEELIQKGQYQKAAFVYLKLLKNYVKAAETLEAGKFYQEAATVYLQHVKDKRKAAACYERGMMTDQAIELYKELNDYEKVGDLYLTVSKKEEAMHYFEKKVYEYQNKDQYIKAALLCRNKLYNTKRSQDILLYGWKNDRDAFNCLNNYLAAIEEPEALKTAIASVHLTDVNETNRELFIKILYYEYNKKNEIQEWIKDLAYEVIAEQIKVNPAIVSELKAFNKNDHELGKDTLKFIMNRKNKR